MDFSDEPYVRKYTRKTLTSRLLRWEGRAVLDAMLGEFDAAGIFAIRGDAAECISAVTEIPVEVVRIGLQRLVETETWVVTGKAITWPTYEEAQNCMRSDRQRQRESRRVRAARSVTDVTPPSSTVTDVTSGHAESLSPRARVGAHAHASSLPPSPPSGSTTTTARKAESSPVVLKEIPEDYELDDELRAEAIAAGVPPSTIDERFNDLKRGPIGGQRGIFARELRNYIRRQFPKWRTWNETDSARQTRAGPKRASSRDVPNQPNAGVTGLEKAIVY